MEKSPAWHKVFKNREGNSMSRYLEIGFEVVSKLARNPTMSRLGTHGRYHKLVTAACLVILLVDGKEVPCLA